ncbi:adhesion G protein-coupled receptor E3 [Ochotona princeps]|uniref:adhesion G protein-coupled receptor E3 n=1 Tax=Ochotona princeps TaxID=9978 RepID=UPI002714F5E4|nr:adhesion G protein-coupled receptor E3 [Ochotona princeps]
MAASPSSVSVTALGVLLTLSISGIKNSGAQCPVCPQNARCHNSTHCACAEGFQPRFVKFYERCEDIDECQTGAARCKPVAFCRNRIGRYICSCVVNASFWVNLLASFITVDHPDCYTAVTLWPWEMVWPWATVSYEDPTEAGVSPEPTHSIAGTDIFAPSEDRNQKMESPGDVWINLRRNTSKQEFARNATQTLQQVELAIWNASLTFPHKGENPLFGIVYESKKCHEASEHILLEAGNNTMLISCSGAFQTTGGRNAVALITHQSLGDVLNASFFSPRRGVRGAQLNSRIVSGTVGLSHSLQLDEPVSLTFQHTRTDGGANWMYFCVYWAASAEGGSWSTDGCSHVYSNETHTVCSCSHLSSFAVLMALTPKEDPVLTVVTYVGLGVSLLCLFLAALTFLLCPAIRSTGTSIHLQLTLCLFLAHFLFLTGIQRTESQVLCSIVAAALHFLYLAAFVWMLLEGLRLFLTVRNLQVANYTSASRFKKRFMYPLGYGVPAVIVIVCASVGYENYGTYTHCWLSPDNGFIWSFLGPVAAIILINLVFYFQILWILRSKLSSLNKEVSTIQDTRLMTFKAIAQLFVLGCSWGLGYFMVEEMGETVGSVMAYLFTIVNVLQGLLLFVMHCLLDRQVRTEYRKWLCGLRRGAETDSSEMSRSTGHTRTEELRKSQCLSGPATSSWPPPGTAQL